MSTLTKLGRRYGTDKCSKHNYTTYYELYFNSLKDKELTILEIGVRNAASIKMWLDYFHKAHVIGIDIEDCGFRSDNYSFILGSQFDSYALDKVLLAADGMFDIIIDDGSHVSDHQQFSLDYLGKCVKDQGYYCIEDLQCIREANTEKSTFDFINACYKGNKNVNGLFSIVHLDKKLAILQKEDCDK